MMMASLVRSPEMEKASQDLSCLNPNITIQANRLRRSLCKNSDGFSHWENGHTTIVDIDQSLPPKFIEPTYIHEILHAILRYEEYPLAKSNISNNIVDEIVCGLQSAMDHPEIYYRMEKYYKINMSREIQFKRLCNIKKKFCFLQGVSNVTPIGEVFVKQQCILQYSECYNYDEKNRSEILSYYELNYPEPYEISNKIYDKFESANLSDPTIVCEYGKELVCQIIKLGDKHNTPNNDFWHSFDFFRFALPNLIPF